MEKWPIFEHREKVQERNKQIRKLTEQILDQVDWKMRPVVAHKIRYLLTLSKWND